MRDIQGDQYALFFLIFWILWTIYFIFNVVLFFQKKGNVYIKCRAPNLIFSSGLGQYFMITVLVWEIIILPNHFPTIIDNWFIYLCIPLHLMPYPIRAIRFLIQYHLNSYQSIKITSMNDPNFRQNKVWEWFMANPKYRSDWAFFALNWILQGALIIFGIYRNITVKKNHPGKIGIPHENSYYITCTIMLVIASIIVWTTVYFMFRIEDTVYYRVESIAIGLIWLVFIGLYIIFDYLKVGDFRLPLIMLVVLCVASFMMSFGMPVQLAQTDDSYKEQAEENNEAKIERSPSFNRQFTTMELTIIQDNGQESTKIDENQKWLEREKENVKRHYTDLQNCLADPDCHLLFAKHLQGQQCPEALLFYDEVQIYKAIAAEDPELKIKFASIREQYILEGSAFQVNVGSRFADPIVSMQPDEATPNTYDGCNTENLRVMKTDCFPHFRLSAKYKQFVEQKQNEIQLPLTDA